MYKRQQEESPLDGHQRREVQAAQDRLAALDRALEAAGSEQQIARAIQNVRNQVLKEAAGRSQQDSQVAQAIRRQEQLSGDLSLQRLAQEADRRRSSEARESAIHQVFEQMDARIRDLIHREGAPARDRAEADAHNRARREAIQAAARSFRLDELGQGKLEGSGGNPKYQQARFHLIAKVFALGDARTPLMEANWKTWLHRLDKSGRQRYTIRWAAFLKHQMAELVQELAAGTTDACLQWHRRLTREWDLNAGSFQVPGSLPPPSSQPEHMKANPGDPSK